MLAGAYAGGDLTIFTDSAHSAEVWSWSVGGGHAPVQALERLRQTDDADLTWEAIDDSRRADRRSEHMAARSRVIESMVARTVLRVAGRHAPLLRMGGSVIRLVHENPNRYVVSDLGSESPQDVVAGVGNAPQLLQDTLEDPDSIDGLRAVWRALLRIRMLDGSCGRGDWLLGVLSSLERLYLACLEQMRIRLAEEVISRNPRRATFLRDFRVAISRAGDDQRAWVREAIALENLYGIDTSAAAVSLCRRRLAPLFRSDRPHGREPLPASCLNLSQGALHHGFHRRRDLEHAFADQRAASSTRNRLLQELDSLARADRLVRRMRLDYAATSALTEWAIDGLRERRKKLANELDEVAARRAGVDTSKRRQTARWIEENSPLHLLVEWPQLDSVGFDLTRPGVS